MLDRLLAGAVAVPFALGLSTAPASDRGDVAFTFRDHEIIESSGLVVQGGLVLTTNDSGDSGRVFAVDPATGETVGVTHWADEPTDVEALAPAGGGAVWVGDIGDNTGSRDAVQVARVPVGRGERTVDPTTYDLTYPDGTPNAETLLADPGTGRLYVATKSVFGGALYAAPEKLSADHPNRLTEVGGVLPIATDGAFLPDGRHLVLRDYSLAVVYTFPDLEEVAAFRLPEQEQGEGLAVLDDETLLVSTEGQATDVLRVPLPEDVRRVVAATGPGAGSTGGSSRPGGPSDATASPGPSSGRAGGSGSGTDGERPGWADDQRPTWPWLLTGGVGLAAIVVLLRSLRPR